MTIPIENVQFNAKYNAKSGTSAKGVEYANCFCSSVSANDKYVQWAGIVAFRENARFVAALQEGDRFLVSGEISISQYMNKEGENKSNLQIIANKIELLPRVEDKPELKTEDLNDMDEIPF